MGCYRDVSRQAVLYDSGIRDDWRVSIGDYGVTYALRQPEILTAGDTSPVVETDWVGVVCGVLLNFRDHYCLSTGAGALCFPDFWVDTACWEGEKEALKFRLHFSVSSAPCFKYRGG